MKVLTDKELLIMNMLWKSGPLFVREMIDRIPEPKPHFNTISTFVRILEQKGYVGHESVGNSHRYHALLSRDAYRSLALREFISEYFNGSGAELLSMLLRELQLSDDEMWDLMNELRQSRKRKD